MPKATRIAQTDSSRRVSIIAEIISPSSDEYNQLGASFSSQQPLSDGQRNGISLHEQLKPFACRPITKYLHLVEILAVCDTGCLTYQIDLVPLPLAEPDGLTQPKSGYWQ